MPLDDSFQTRVTVVLLAAIDDAGFVLAGAGAIRAHGLTARPTYDVDLFASSTLSEPAFAAAVRTGTLALINSGLRVTVARSVPLFARLLVESPSGETIEVDLGVDWRQEPPVRFAVGPVLSLRDAVGSKTATVFSRGEVRDLLDVDSIRQSAGFSDAELLRLATEYDAGLSPTVLADNLERFANLSPARTAQYGVSPDDHRQIADRLEDWARSLRAGVSGTDDSEGAQPD